METKRLFKNHYPCLELHSIITICVLGSKEIQSCYFASVSFQFWKGKLFLKLNPNGKQKKVVTCSCGIIISLYKLNSQYSFDIIDPWVIEIKMQFDWKTGLFHRFIEYSVLIVMMLSKVCYFCLMGMFHFCWFIIIIHLSFSAYYNTIWKCSPWLHTIAKIMSWEWGCHLQSDSFEAV